jgi:hypothetical protein
VKSAKARAAYVAALMASSGGDHEDDELDPYRLLDDDKEARDAFWLAHRRILDIEPRPFNSSLHFFYTWPGLWARIESELRSPSVRT